MCVGAVRCAMPRRCRSQHCVRRVPISTTAPLPIDHQVQDRVKQQPGLVTYETLVDTADPDKHVVMTVWESKAHLETWLEDPWYKAKCDEFDELLDDDASYDIFVLPRDEPFLL